MTTRRWAATGLLLLAASLLLWWSTRELKRDECARVAELHASQDEMLDNPDAATQKDPQVSASKAMMPAEQVGPPAGGTPIPEAGLAMPASPAGAKAGSPGATTNIEQQLDQVNLMLRDYRTIAGENPVGTNAEIMQALMGKNPRQAVLGPPPGQRLNAAGELIDPWGTPYFFHQLSGSRMEIRSAGIDRQMWTDDDQTVTSGSGVGVR